MENAMTLMKKYENAMEKVAELKNLKASTNPMHGVLYLSHPFGGLKDNIIDTGRVANVMQERLGDKGTILSPVHNFEWLSYREETVGYWEDISHCLDLLSVCQGMILSGDWKKSLGCCIEYLYAVDHHIPIYYYKQ